MHWTRRPTWTALAASGLGGLAALALTQQALAEAGLLLVATAVGVGALIGLPIAMAEQRSLPDSTSPLGGLRRGLTEVWLVVAIGAAIASAGLSLSWLGILLIVLAWGAGLVRGWPGRLAGGALVLLAVGSAGIYAVTGAVGGFTQTLLQPPDSVGVTTIFGATIPWLAWLGPTLVSGLLLSGVGLGLAEPGSEGRRWAVAARVGAGGLLLLAAALALADAYESTGLVGTAIGGLGLVLVYGLPAAMPLVAPIRRGSNRFLLASLGLSATFLFIGPAHEALPLWWLGLFPVGLALSLALAAIASRGRGAITLWLGAVLTLAIPLLAWPPMPGPFAAGVLALAPVVAVWVAGTALIRGRHA